MRTSDLLATIASTFFGGVTGWLIGGSLGAVLGAFAFGGLAIIGARANVRPAIVATVLVATMTGALIGSSIVQAICLPSACTALEITGGTVTAVLSFIGVGLVAALVTRSFDEYNERIDAGLPPTGVGCETPEVEE